MDVNDVGVPSSPKLSIANACCARVEWGKTHCTNLSTRASRAKRERAGGASASRGSRYGLIIAKKRLHREGEEDEVEVPPPKEASAARVFTSQEVALEEGEEKVEGGRLACHFANQMRKERYEEVTNTRRWNRYDLWRLKNLYSADAKPMERLVPGGRSGVGGHACTPLRKEATGEGAGQARGTVAAREGELGLGEGVDSETARAEEEEEEEEEGVGVRVGGVRFSIDVEEAAEEVEVEEEEEVIAESIALEATCGPIALVVVEGAVDSDPARGNPGEDESDRRSELLLDSMA